jgi:peroxiredoxin
MMPLGARAPDFSLPDLDGKMASLADFREHDALLIVFLCSHCEYTRHLRDGLNQFARQYRPRGVAIVGINANDDTYAEDRPELMAKERYAFPYLYDATQALARALGAACTPDFFLFDRERRLFYRGQFDESRPTKSTPVTGADLRRAADAALRGESPPEEQRPSLGCNIKWRPEGAPDYFKPGLWYWALRWLQRR